MSYDYLFSKDRKNQAIRQAGPQRVFEKLHAMRGRLIAFGAILIPAFLTGMALDSQGNPPSEPPSPSLQLEPSLRVQQALPLPDYAATPNRPPSAKQATIQTISIKVLAGDTLASLFSRYGLSAATLAKLQVTKHGKQLARIRPGQTLTLYIDDKKNLQRLVLPLDVKHSLHLIREHNNFRSTKISEKLETRLNSAEASITNSLFLAGKRSGLSDDLIMQMVDIFGWDIDFALDIRTGDRFTLIFEELYRAGEKVANGSIVAAEFVNRGKAIRAIRYTDASGHSDYYTPNGHSLRKAFLRSPVKFSRISSRFNLRRKHPVLHRVRAHRGVDYAAPRGTPIRATGDGKIAFASRKGGYGKTLIIRHGSTYSTLYAHLHRFARGIRGGKSVRQGQLVAYVGSSGLATGPHLHYEFRVRGRHRNPLTVALPKARSIAKRFRADYQRHGRKVNAQLNLIARLTVAQNSNSARH